MKKTRKPALFVLVMFLVLAVVGVAACKENLATITFDGNGSTGGTAPKTVETVVGETITLPECTFTKTGHTFAGWKLGDKVYEAGDTYEVKSADTTFIAIWKADEQQTPTTYTVTYKSGNHGTGNDIVESGLTGSIVLKDSSAFTADSLWFFDCWSIEGDTAVYNVREHYDLSEDVIFVAQWTQDFYLSDNDDRCTLYLDFSSNSGAVYFGDDDDEGVELTFTLVDEEITVILDGTGFPGTYSDGQLDLGIMYEEEIYIFGNFQIEQPETFTVTFDPNNGENSWSEQVDEGETVIKPVEDPTNSNGKAFRYWASDNGDEFDFSTPITENIELTAVYAWKVTFLAGEGTTGTVEPQWIRVWNSRGIELPDGTGLSNGDKIFAGWTDGTDTYNAGDFYVGTANETLTAVWKSNQKFALTYEAGSHGTGTAPEVELIVEGESVTLAAANTFTAEGGFVFNGWLVEGEQTTRAAGSKYVMPAKSVTIIAQWKEVSQTLYTVTFFKSADDSQIDSIIGNVPETMQLTEGATITLPTADTLTLAHYTLTQWRVFALVIDSDGSSRWDTLTNVGLGAEYTMPAKNIQIKGVWAQNKVTVSFDANGGSGTMAPVQKNYAGYLGSGLFTCQFTAPVNKEFAGWSLTANGPVIESDPKISEIVGDSDAVTLYAIWTATAVTPTTPLIDEIKGSWSASGHTIDIIAGAETNNPYVKGYAILDGQHFLRVLDNDGTYLLYNGDSYDIETISGDYEPNPYYLAYVVSYVNSALTLTPEEGNALTFSNKTALENISRDTFVGKWSKVAQTNSQPWVITDTDAYFNASLTKASLTMVIGDKFVIVTESIGYEYVYVLAKQTNNLVGLYKAPEKAPADVTFSAGEFLTLTVEGALNQIVNVGQVPDAAKISTPTAPEGQTFSQWVIAGTETEFDPSVAMTEDVYIEAKFEANATAGGQSFVGSCTITIGAGFLAQEYTISEFIIDFDSLEAKCKDSSGNEYQMTMKSISTANMPSGVYDGASYYEVWISAKASFQRYIIVNSDQTRLTLCDDQDEVHANGEFILKTDYSSPWVPISATDKTSALYQLGQNKKRLYFEESFEWQGYTFVGIDFTLYQESVAIKVVYLSNGEETASTSFTNVSAEDGQLRFKPSSGSYINGTVIAMDNQGNFYVTSFYYKETYTEQIKLVEKTEA